MKSFKAGAEFGLSTFMNFDDKSITLIIDELEKGVNKLAKQSNLRMDGMFSIFQLKPGCLGSILQKRPQFIATVSKKEQSFFKSHFEDGIKMACKKLATIAKKKKLVIVFQLRCWSI